MVVRPAPGRLPLIMFTVDGVVVDVSEADCVVVRPEPGRLPLKMLDNPLVVKVSVVVNEFSSLEGEAVVVVEVVRPDPGLLPPRRLANNPVVDTVEEASVVVVVDTDGATSVI